MVLLLKQDALAKRLKEIEREKRLLREQIEAVRRLPDTTESGGGAPRLRAPALPKHRTMPPPEIPMHTRAELRRTERTTARITAAPAAESKTEGVCERNARETPEHLSTLDFEPAPDGLELKQAVAPRIQRMDMLHPYPGRLPPTPENRLQEPEFDRFRNYVGAMNIQRAREARKEHGHQRVKAIFMAGMVLLLGFIFFRMMT